MGPLRRDQYVFCDSHDQVLQRKTVRLFWYYGGTMEWRSPRGSARTQCGPPIPSCLGMKVRSLVV